MKKIKLIWREVLTTALEEKRVDFEQKELASQFNLSTSTVFHGLEKPRRMEAVETREPLNILLKELINRIAKG